MLTHWQDEQAFQYWVGSDDFKLAHQNPMNKEAFLEGGGLERIFASAASPQDAAQGRAAQSDWSALGTDTRIFSRA